MTCSLQQTGTRILPASEAKSVRRRQASRSPDFRRGGYIPREFRNRQYYVTDFRAHHLSPPPRGQQWVQVGPDYVLIAIATGLIAHMVLSH
jgi:Ni/Co efflux regulator RcnB